MSSEELQILFSTIKGCPFFDQRNPPCNRIKKFEPVINTFSPKQRYMIISSDPSRDTDKKLDESVPHSDFALRFFSLIFTGSDSVVGTEKILKHYSDFRRIFNKYFYWTHFSKCYAQGNPNNHCAQTYLKREIDLFKPSLVILLGSKLADFLLGKDKLTNRVNRIMQYGNTSIIASLHPSRDWNLSRRPKYLFDETWGLIRSTIQYSPGDSSTINQLLKR